MKTVVKSIVILLGLFSVVGVTVAQDNFRVGVVDSRRVMRDSKPGKEYAVAMEKMVKERKEKLSQEEDKIKALQQDMEKNSLTLTEAQKDQKRKDIESRVKNFRQMARDAEDEVKKRDNELAAVTTKALSEIIDQIAKQKNVAMVIDKGQAGIYWVQEDVDLTDDVIKAYDAKPAASKK